MCKLKNGTHRGYKNTRKNVPPEVVFTIGSLNDDPIIDKIFINDLGSFTIVHGVAQGEYNIVFDTAQGFNDRTYLHIPSLYFNNFSEDLELIFLKSQTEGDSTFIQFHCYDIKSNSLIKIPNGAIVHITIRTYE